MARSVLIVKLAAIGDVVMALPMVEAIRMHSPDTRISWMCGRAVAPLLTGVEGIDELFVVDEAALLAGSPIQQGLSVSAAWRKTTGRRFDAIYIAHSDPRYRLLASPIRCPDKRWLGGNGGRRGLLAGRSHTDEYVRLVTGIDDHRARRYPFPVLRTDLPASIGQRLLAFNPQGRPVVALAPGGARNVARESPLRRWPLERYVELAESLQTRGYAVVVTGATSDDWVRPAFRGSPALDLVGATDLPALAAVLRSCAAVVAHDSGPLHLARLVGTPVVALLGPTAPTMFFRGESRASVLWPGGSLACAPCYDGRSFADCPRNVCMQMIDGDAVLERIDHLVEARGAAPDPHP